MVILFASHPGDREAGLEAAGLCPLEAHETRSARHAFHRGLAEAGATTFCLPSPSVADRAASGAASGLLCRHRSSIVLERYL